MGLTTLEKRRHRGDLIQIFKIVHGLEKVDWKDKVKLTSETQHLTPTRRRHNLQLRREKALNCEARHYFLLNRIATPWNNLPPEIAMSNSVNKFKNLLDNHLEKINWRTQVYN